MNVSLYLSIYTTGRTLDRRYDSLRLLLQVFTNYMFACCNTTLITISMVYVYIHAHANVTYA